jgi:Transcriptional regulator, AbiEi antitoxin
MHFITPALAAYAADRYGVLSTAELRAFGLPRSQTEKLVTAGLLVPVFRGVYRLLSAPDVLEARSRAICLAAPDAVITGRAGGRLWGVRRMGKIGSIEVRAPHYCNSLNAPFVTLRRCNAIDPVDVVHRPDGIRVVSPPRLAFDLAADLSELDLESVIEQILDQRWCTAPTLIDTGRRLYHPARPGSTRFLKVMTSRPAWMKPADSHDEVVLFDALRTAGIRGLTRQHRLDLPDGWAIHADIAVPELRWAIPVDHVTWHGGRISQQRDKQNDRQATRIGWTVSRVTDEDIRERLVVVTHELVEIHHRLILPGAS